MLILILKMVTVHECKCNYGKGKIWENKKKELEKFFPINFTDLKLDLRWEEDK